jgi:anti-anti-sigma factor
MTELARVETGTVDGIEIVRIAGEIDISNATLVRDALGAAIPDLPEVVLDLTGTEYLDSAGLGMLFRLAERLSYNRQELRLVIAPNAAIRAVIRLTGLDQVVPVREEPAEGSENRQA